MSQEILSGKITTASGVVASGGALTPTHSYGSYLVNNGFEVLSYAECIQIAGFCWIMCLLGKTILVPALKAAKELLCHTKK